MTSRFAPPNALLDADAADEGHKSAKLTDTLGGFIVEYDEAHYHLTRASTLEVIRYLMLKHDVKQSDLPEIASQGVVSEILNGKSEHNTRQIAELPRTIQCAPCCFLRAAVVNRSLRFKPPCKNSVAFSLC
jgi:HTH-type transcriptional regulator/antitoxin HigA